MARRLPHHAGTHIELRSYSVFEIELREFGGPPEHLTMRIGVSRIEEGA
jgi:hypothetical protein